VLQYNEENRHTVLLVEKAPFAVKKLKAGGKIVIFPPAFGSSMTRVPPVKGTVDRKFLSLAGDGTKIFCLPAFGAPAPGRGRRRSGEIPLHRKWKHLMKISLSKSW